MAWITPVTADLSAILAAPEISVLRTLVQDGQSDPVEEALASAIREVRGFIMSRRRLEAGLTVPEELKRVTLILARHTLISRIPDGRLVTEGRRAEYADALTLLRSVARGEFGFEESSAPVTPASAPATAKIIQASSGLQRSQVRF